MVQITTFSLFVIDSINACLIVQIVWMNMVLLFDLWLFIKTRMFISYISCFNTLYPYLINEITSNVRSDRPASKQTTLVAFLIASENPHNDICKLWPNPLVIYPIIDSDSSKITRSNCSTILILCNDSNCITTYGWVIGPFGNSLYDLKSNPSPLRLVDSLFTISAVNVYLNDTINILR